MKMTPEKLEQKARELLENQTLAELLDEWEMTSKIDKPEIPMIRGGLLDEFIKRNPEGFYAWIDQDLSYDHDLRKYMLGR